jgi:hypothetical protein
MDERPANPIVAFDDVLETARILRAKLGASDTDNGDGAHEAITIMLHQMLGYFGVESVAAQQLFPAMDTIKRRIDSGNYVGAVWDTESLTRSLQEIRDMIASQGG